VRAFDPFPGGVAILEDGTALKVWSAEPVEAANEAARAEPGTIVHVSPEGVVVACGEGALRLTQLQKPGGKRLPVREFLAGAALTPGQRLRLPEAA
jgi:methionyl-tRNA formyltransferase